MPRFLLPVSLCLALLLWGLACAPRAADAFCGSWQGQADARLAEDLAQVPATQLAARRRMLESLYRDLRLEIGADAAFELRFRHEGKIQSWQGTWRSDAEGIALRSATGSTTRDLSARLRGRTLVLELPLAGQRFSLQLDRRS